MGGREVRRVERSFLARVAGTAVAPSRATQTDIIREYRWWTAAELWSTCETVVPVGLADLVTVVAEGRMPEHPVVLAS